MLEKLGPRREILDRVAELAREQGVRACLVGGAIVDLLEDRSVKDLDVVVVGDAPVLARALAERFGGKVLVHKAFRTATWTTADGEAVDLVTARGETYAAPAVLPEVEPGTLDEDLARRDFTVLAMAVDLTSGALIDPAGGRRDLEARLLRVQHPNSFVDDPTRVWRGARWAHRLDLDLESSSRRAIALARQAGAPQALGLERLGKEVDRLFHEPDAFQSMDRLSQWGWLSTLHPALDAPFVHRLKAVECSWHHDHVKAGGPPVERPYCSWLVLASCIPEADRNGLERLVPGGGMRLRLWRDGPDRVTKAADALNGLTDRARIGRALEDLHPAERVMLWEYAKDAHHPALEWWESTGRHKRTEVTAQDLLDAAVPQGPALGRGLRAAQDAAWQDEPRKGQFRAALDAAT